MEHITETQVTLRLTDAAHIRLIDQAAKSGRDLSELASELIEQFVSRPSIAEIMAPVHSQVSDGGLSDSELASLLEGQLKAHRDEKKAKSA